MDILKTLVTTPVPTLLVLAGLFFIFVALGGQLGATFVTDRVKPMAAGILGLVLLVAGVAIFLMGAEIEPGRSGGRPEKEVGRAPEPAPGTEGAGGREMSPEAGIREGPHPDVETHILDLEYAIQENEELQKPHRAKIAELEPVAGTEPGARIELEERRHVLEQLQRKNTELRRELDQARAGR